MTEQVILYLKEIDPIINQRLKNINNVKEVTQPFADEKEIPELQNLFYLTINKNTLPQVEFHLNSVFVVEYLEKQIA